MYNQRDLDQERERREELGQQIHETRALEKDAIPQINVLQMHKDLRSWAITSLLFGALSIFAGGTLDPIWGIVMIATAVLAWRVKLPAMFVLYSVTMAWAALMNGVNALLGGDLPWLGASLLQVYWVYSIMRRWKRYTRFPLEQVYESGDWPAAVAPPQSEPSITGAFAIAGIVLAVIALVLVPGTFILNVAFIAITQTAAVPTWVFRLIEGAVDVGVMALGLSLAAMLSRNERKGWAIGGTVVSAVVLGGWLLVVLLLTLS